MSKELKNPVIHIQEKYPGLKESHPEIYIECLEGILTSAHEIFYEGKYRAIESQEETV